MKQVFKYKIDQPTGSGLSSVLIVAGGEVLSVSAINNQLYLWVLVDPVSIGQEIVDLRIFGTGHDINCGLGRFLGTVSIHGGRMVWHVWRAV